MGAAFIVGPPDRRGDDTSVPSDLVDLLFGTERYRVQVQTEGATMAGELADVMVCVAILAGSHDVDLGKAVAAKLEKIEARHHGAP